MRDSHTSIQFSRDDVSFYWTGGRNVTWRLTHEPTGISVEGSTRLTAQQFTKKRLRMAEQQLQARLLADLRQRVVKSLARQPRAE
jgi:hypothetical protein